jgi:hypothetical protein
MYGCIVDLNDYAKRCMIVEPIIQPSLKNREG